MSVVYNSPKDAPYPPPIICKSTLYSKTFEKIPKNQLKKGEMKQISVKDSYLP